MYTYTYTLGPYSDLTFVHNEPRLGFLLPMALTLSHTVKDVFNRTYLYTLINLPNPTHDAACQAGRHCVPFLEFFGITRPGIEP